MEDAIDEFGDKEDRQKVGDALVRIIYDDKFPDFILKFDSKRDKSTDHTDTIIEMSKENLCIRLFVEHETDSSKNVTYVKIWTPFMKQCEAAEEIRIKKELAIIFLPNGSIGKIQRRIWMQKAQRYCFTFLEQLKPQLIVTANIIIPEVNDQKVLQTVRLRSFGFENLIEEKVYTTFYPLHDGKADDKKKENLRAKLYGIWIKKSRKRQPLNEIREYFGEKLAMYFAWLGLYTSWLFVASVLGIINVIYGIIDFVTCSSQLQQLELLLFSREWFKNFDGWGSFLSSTTNLGIVLTLSLFYRKLAIKLTNLENHKTATSFEDSHILKVYLFDFVNFYAALFYILIFKQWLPKKIFHDNARVHVCENDDCMRELTIQLAVILIGRQAVGQLQELGLPDKTSKKELNEDINVVEEPSSKKELDEEINVVEESASKKRMNEEIKDVEKELNEKIKVGKESTSYPWIIDNDLLPTENDDIRKEYERMTVQFGFISLFVVAFPLTPLCAWFNNIVEIRTDGFKFVGNDEKSLLIVRLAFILAFENLVLLVKVLSAYIIPDMPDSVKLAIKRHEYLERVAIAKRDLATDEYLEDNDKQSVKLTKYLKFSKERIETYKIIDKDID
ncbi:10262_t:CDS:10 [Ambispora gerdemannii]|uniref:10262_t:CDS:1 n=1 Tax=Ambispora gerdemannii TaxID=144530 RepID=A0A9N9AFH7_9GLOM|nr:10262_t:CDS:10 [Ambispora gerdemannii]